ncbi:MAG: hypothetical protein ACJ8AW_06710 [Rhodopila sp.]
MPARSTKPAAAAWKARSAGARGDRSLALADGLGQQVQLARIGSLRELDERNRVETFNALRSLAF